MSIKRRSFIDLFLVLMNKGLVHFVPAFGVF